MLIAQSVPKVVEQNGCMSCHSIMGAKDKAPAFKGVAKKNKKWFGDKAEANIINSIKNGSSGKYRRFTNQTMPPYANISQEDLKTISNWILSLHNGKSGQGQGNKNF